MAELRFACGTSAWQAPGCSLGIAYRSQQNDKVETNIFYYIMQLILLLPGFWQASFVKAEMVMEGHGGSPIGAVYRQYLT